MNIFNTPEAQKIVQEVAEQYPNGIDEVKAMLQRLLDQLKDLDNHAWAQDKRCKDCDRAFDSTGALGLTENKDPLYWICGDCIIRLKTEQPEIREEREL
jgi:hypothetical protein